VPAIVSKDLLTRTAFVRRASGALVGALLAMLALPATARAADAAGCKDPAWAQPRLAGFQITECTDKPWATLSVDLPAGAKALAGHRTTVSYSQIENAKTAGAKAAEQYHVNLAEKAGAKLVSSPDDEFGAVLTRTSPTGESWYIYTHDGGDEDSTAGYTLTTVEIAPLKQDVRTQPMKAPLDVGGQACANPPWLVSPFPHFTIDSCERKTYDTVDLDLTSGSKTVAGKKLAVTYTLADEKQDPVALAVQRNYVTALEGIGAKLMTDPDDAYHAVLTQTTPNGEYWYIYDHGSGNDDSTGSYTLTTFEVGAFQQVVQARPIAAHLDAQVKPCAGPPWLVKQFDLFKVDTCENRDLDAVEVTLAGDTPKVIAGTVLRTDYALTDEAHSPTAAYIRQNYVNALEGIGAKLVSDPGNGFEAVLTQKTQLGEFWYRYRHESGNDATTGSYSLTTIEVGAPPKPCTLVVYGINFDFNQSALRPDSEPVLNQLLAIFTNTPAYAGEIGGHTDNVGTAAYNLKLSAARAEAVKTWLVGRGVAAARITTHGYGDTRPLVPNTSDANRAKNRRVELKRENCGGR
jgi:outer membrane protein OmpA-like peptidoglycan-associated protein